MGREEKEVGVLVSKALRVCRCDRLFVLVASVTRARVTLLCRSAVEYREVEGSFGAFPLTFVQEEHFLPARINHIPSDKWSGVDAVLVARIPQERQQNRG